MSEKKGYYAIIPANVRYDKELTPNAKLLYGEITALCNEKGFCWASNSYFAKLYEVTTGSISKWVNQLARKGYVATKMIYEEGSKEIRERRIYLDPIKEKVDTPQTKVSDPIKEKLGTPMKEMFKDNTTSFNNTVNTTANTTTNTGGGGSENLFKEIVQMFEHNGFGSITQNTSEMIINLEDTYTGQWLKDAMEIAIINNKRNLGYVEAILKRWFVEGKNNDKKDAKPKKSKWEADAT